MSPLNPILLVACLFLGSVLYVHRRGRVRLRPWRQLTDHSTFAAPYNVLVYLFSAVPNRPILDADGPSELAPLRKAWPVLRDEALALQAGGHLGMADRFDDIAFNSFFKRGWRRFYLKWYGDFLPSAEQLCPRSIEAVRSIPSINAALFAYLPPGSRLGKHRDPFAGSLRYHLGLVTANSDRCWISIDGERYWWRDGEDILFDPTYIHQAANETDQGRIILFCDVARPLHTRTFRAINRFVTRAFMPLTAARNDDSELLGSINVVGRHVYRWLLKNRDLRKRYGRAYFAGRALLLALTAALLLWWAFAR